MVEEGPKLFLLRSYTPILIILQSLNAQIRNKKKCVVSLQHNVRGKVVQPQCSFCSFSSVLPRLGFTKCLRTKVFPML
jgi:hypothetical protein